jgi:hypothetical protein
MGARTPSFVGDADTIVYTTDGGELRLHDLESGSDLAIPPAWRFVYSPDWAPPPRSCMTDDHCI